MTTRQVMEAVGQPYTRLGNRSTFCAETADDDVRMRVTFGSGGGYHVTRPADADPDQSASTAKREQAGLAVVGDARSSSTRIPPPG